MQRKKPVALFAVLLIAVVSGCGGGSSGGSVQDAAPDSQSPELGSNGTPCGDGVCDWAEQADPDLCPQDCEDFGSSSPGTIAGGDASTPTGDGEALPNELVFVPDPGIRIRVAAQPAPIIGPDGAIYVFYNNKEVLSNDPGSNAVARSEDGLTFDEVGLDPDEVSVINPFATLLPDGIWRLYDVSPDTGVVTSRSSPDGIRFAEDDGTRYTAPAEHLPIGIRDFYVNPAGDVIFLYIGAMGESNHYIRHAVSTDGGDTFTLWRDDILGDKDKDNMDRNLDPKFVVLPDGGARLFTMVQGDVVIPGQRACCSIYSFTSDDGYIFTQDPGIRLQPSDFTEFTVWSLNDPWVIQLPDGRFRMYVAALVDDGSTDEPFWAVVSATNP